MHKKFYHCKWFISFFLILIMITGFLPSITFAIESKPENSVLLETTENDMPLTENSMGEETSLEAETPLEIQPSTPPTPETDASEINAAALRSGSGTAQNPYVLTLASDLYNLANQVNSGNTHAGIYFELGNNIDLSAYANWPGIGRQTKPFSGNLNGNNFTITGLRGTDPDGYGQYGLFGCATSASIKNVYLELGGSLSAVYDTGAFIGKANNGTQISNCHVDGNGYTINVTGGGRAGGFAGWTNEELGTGTTVYFNNCSVRNINTYSSGNYSAGFIGVAHNAEVTDCEVLNTDSNKNNATIYAAGFVAAAHGNSKFTNCSVTSPNIIGRSTGDSWSGGFAGVFYGSSKASACYTTNPKINATACNGGFAGGIYNSAQIDNCDVTEPVVKGIDYYQGGFAAKIYDYSSVTNCYTTGGKVTQGNRLARSYGVGGFVADLYGNATVTNSYTQTDVENNKAGSTDTNCSTGGFAAYIRENASAKNCYSTGSVFISNSGSQKTYQVGGFVSYKDGMGSITNCYSTGTVSAPNANQYVGGFIGYYYGNGLVSNCFFDTTTTRLAIPVGNTSISGVQSYTTSQMILKKNYPSGWGLKENLLGKANGTGSLSSPWYIDDDLTYPYLYYQYDGHSKEDTNYHIANTIYQNGNSIGQKRADFTVKQNSLPLRALSAGATKAYIPYSGTSQHVINTNSYVEIPGAAYNSNLHSLGGVSKTNIIAFSSAPIAEKRSDRVPWNVDDEATYTYVGDTVTYSITVLNYSSEADFKDVIVTDNIHENVRLLENTITVNPGVQYKEDEAQLLTTDNASKPYYSYDAITRKLSVYLEDMPKLDANTGEISSYTISFQVFVEKEAASKFSDRTTYIGDIENTGLLDGKLVFTGNTNKESNYQYDFTDGNKDPVYDACLFDFTKNDTDRNLKLAGASFSTYYWTGDGVPTGQVDKTNTTTNVSEKNKWYLCDESISSPDGFVQLRLGKYPTAYAGYYQIIETSAPEGYLTPAGQWLLHVNEIAYVDKITTIQSSETEAIPAKDFETTSKIVDSKEVIDTANLSNQKLTGSVTLKKFNETNKPLPGAQFTIERFDESSNSWKYISYNNSTNQWMDWISGDHYTQETILENNTAITIFKELAIGRYRFTEVTSPTGYETLLLPFEGTIPTLDNNSDPIYDITFEIHDNQAIQMPASGREDFMSKMMLLIGIFIILLSFGGGALRYLSKHKHTT